MEKKGIKSKLFNILTLQIVAILGILLLAIALLWHGNTTSIQAVGATAAKVYFDGEYRIADGQWQQIIKGNHIPATEGDVTLRGNFHMLYPDGRYYGLYTGNSPIAFYVNHISLTFYDSEGRAYVVDHENPRIGESACGVDWSTFAFAKGNTQPIEILIHNPHNYGNETAIDDLLSNITFWSGIDFEKDVLKSGESQRNTGLFFVIVSVVFLGTALFSTLVHMKKSKILWMLGIVIFFAGMYFAYSADGVSFWSESIISNTIILGCAIMFYMLFLSMTLVHFITQTKRIGTLTVTVMGIINAVLLVLPIVTDIFFYDTLPYWAIAQIISNIVLIVCLIKEFFATKRKERWLYLCSLLPLIAFELDIAMIGIGIWSHCIASGYTFIIFFAAAMVMLLRIIPNSINIINKAKELETEKIILNAQLAENRIATMMSQIRPHFIYNTLGSIEQLCNIDPPKAGELVHNFAKYLRGNFGELDNPKPILMSQEMEHVRHYISIENVRFPDMTFSFEMNSCDFHIPALTIQPIVENAIKHGLMKLPKGGTIWVTSYDTQDHHCVLVQDNGVGFDTGMLLDDRKHVGLRNIRERLKVMVDGTLEIESTEGVGTKVLITIPKEAGK